MFACPDCGREFQKRNGLVLHQRSKHPTPEERILVDDEYSPDTESVTGPDLSIVQGEAPEFVDGIELVDDDGASLMRHPERAAARARELREQAAQGAGQFSKLVPMLEQANALHDLNDKAVEALVGTPVHLVADGPPPEESPGYRAAREAMFSQAMAAHPNPSAPLTRRHFDNVKFRVKEGPDVQDVMWLVKMLDLADEILQIAAQPHVLDRWNQALSE